MRLRRMPSPTAGAPSGSPRWHAPPERSARSSAKKRFGSSVGSVLGPPVRVLEVRGDIVRIGIDAPRSVAVHRAELLAEVQSTYQGAASPSESAVESLAQVIRQRRR